MRDRLSPPSCASCEHSYYHEERTSRIMKGVRLQPYEHYCFKCKRPRLFRGKDPKHKVPAWCPKRKTPSELRIYSFRTADDWILHEQLCKSCGKEIQPTAYRYAVRRETTSTLSPYEFWRRRETETESELLPVPITLHEVVEFDDGLKPVFFYKTSRGFKVAYGFKPAAAHK